MISAAKPKILWHADADGKCHDGCEQYCPPAGMYSKCWLRHQVTGNNAAPVGGPCPFAVLLDVLRLRPEAAGREQPDENRLTHLMQQAWGCGYRFGREYRSDDESEDIDRMEGDIRVLLEEEP